MRKNLKFIRMLIKMKLSKMMVFRFSFFGAFFVDSSLFILQILMFQAIYSNVDSIGGWSKGQMMIFIGTFSLINALNMVIFFFGIYNIPDKIKSGELDHYITKPVNPLLRLTFESIDLGSIPLVFASIGIILYGIKLSNVSVSVIRIIIYCVLVLMMTLLWYDVTLLLRTIPFFTVSASNLVSIEETFLDMCMRIPGVLFRGAFKVIFYLILPYGVMSTIPTQFITKSLTPQGLIYGFILVLGFTVFTFWFWKLGLKHYKSASS